MALFTGKYDRQLPLLTRLYQLDAENTEEVEEFLIPEEEGLAIVRAVAKGEKKADNSSLEEIVLYWNKDVRDFADLCKFTQCLMLSLFHDGPTVSLFQGLADFSERVQFNWRGLRLQQGSLLEYETDAYRPLAPMEVIRTYKTMGLHFRTIPGITGGIINELSELIADYKRGNIHRKLGECEECSSIFIIEKRSAYCSHRCKARVDMRRKRSKQIM